jgi:hypothetical protein
MFLLQAVEKTTHKELRALYSSPDIIRLTELRRLKLAMLISCIGERRGAYRDLVGKPE